MAFFSQSVTKPTKGVMIGRWLIDGKSQESIEGDTANNFGLKFGIGISALGVFLGDIVIPIL